MDQPERFRESPGQFRTHSGGSLGRVGVEGRKARCKRPTLISMTNTNKRYLEDGPSHSVLDELSVRHHTARCRWCRATSAVLTALDSFSRAGPRQRWPASFIDRNLGIFVGIFLAIICDHCLVHRGLILRRFTLAVSIRSGVTFAAWGKRQKKHPPRAAPIRGEPHKKQEEVQKWTL